MPRSSAPPRPNQSVISRVVEQVRDTAGTIGSSVRDTAGSIGSSVTGLMPGRHNDKDTGGGGTGNDEF
jgi:tetrahydromethanopterin S-methyltransferase subunit F